MTSSTGQMQDRRAFWRLPTFLSCTILMGEESYRAFLLEISSNGAFLSSRCAPQRGCPVSICLQVPGREKAMVLEGHVVRGVRGTSDHGEICRFAVRFDRVTPESLQLIKVLASQAESRNPVVRDPKR